jgi:hypothetical protein
MDHNTHYSAPPEAPESTGLRERTRQALEDAAVSGDAERLKLLEDLYEELSSELERDVGENSSS